MPPADPQRMHAVTFPGPGGPEVLSWTETDAPRAAPDEVVIEVHAAGINNADLLQRQGRYPPPPGASTILGLECSGTISSVGANVATWKVGDAVCALLPGGGYAQRAAIAADQVLPVPAGLSIIEAAAIVEAACTVYSNLGMEAPLRAGMRVLIHGGGSGMGSFAIQWAKAIGAEVFTTAGSAAKLARCAELGADVGINYRLENFREVTASVTGGRGVHRIFDIVGASYLEENLHCLAPDGRLVIIGNSGGSTGDRPLNLGLMMRRRLTVASTTLRARPREQKKAIAAAVLQEVWPLIEAGKIVPVIDKVLSMEQAGEGHKLIASGQTVGKVLLRNPDVAA